MTRALLLVVLAAPALAGAQTTTPGLVLFTEGTSDLVRGPFISLAECEDPVSSVKLSWSTQLVEGGAFPAGAIYTVYASNQEATGPSCLRQSNVTTGTFAGPVGPPIADQGPTATLLPFPAAGFVVAAGLGCDVTADVPIYVCVQLTDSSNNPVGVARGRLTLSVAPPGAPAGVSAEPAPDGALRISWTAATGGPPAYDFVVVATSEPPDPRDAMVHQGVTRALSYRMSGLVNDVPYAIRIYARSEAGNESVPSAAVVATPVAAAFGSPVLPRPPGSGAGGCATGAAGPIAFLAVAALLRRARKRAPRR